MKFKVIFVNLSTTGIKSVFNKEELKGFDILPFIPKKFSANILDRIKGTVFSYCDSVYALNLDVCQAQETRRLHSGYFQSSTSINVTVPFNALNLYVRMGVNCNGRLRWEMDDEQLYEDWKTDKFPAQWSPYVFHHRKVSKDEEAFRKIKNDKYLEEEILSVLGDKDEWIRNTRSNELGDSLISNALQIVENLRSDSKK